MGIQFVVFLAVVSCVCGKVLIKSYYNGETVTPNNPQANVEFHCFELSNKGKPRYVRGTYGGRGYFEGSMNRGVAAVNFYEISLAGEKLVPTTGSAVLSYVNNFAMVSGPFWNGGGGNITAPAEWGITRECRNCRSSMSESDIMENKCLWAKNAAAQPYVPTNVNGVLFGDPDLTINTFTNTIVGATNPLGSSTGGYLYVYTPDDCTQLQFNCAELGYQEHGSFGLHAVSANLLTSKIFVSSWMAVTGPAAGQMGSAIYAISLADGLLRVNGIFCYTYMTTIQSADHDPTDVATLGNCAQDNGPSLTSVNGVTANSILQYFGNSEEVAQLNLFAQSLIST